MNTFTYRHQPTHRADVEVNSTPGNAGNYAARHRGIQALVWMDSVTTHARPNR